MNVVWVRAALDLSDRIGPESVDSRLGASIAFVTIFGVGHHLDHVIRGNHVGWPVTPEVTPFTYSLLFYPVIAIGIVLTLRKRVGAGYWTVVSGAGFVFVAATHFGPLAVEPPGDVVGPYQSRIAGYAALAWLVAFVGSLLFATAYAATRWWTHGALGRFSDTESSIES